MRKPGGDGHTHQDANYTHAEEGDGQGGAKGARGAATCALHDAVGTTREADGAVATTLAATQH